MKESRMQKIWKSYRFSIILLGSIFLGSLIGIRMGAKAKVFKPLGDLFINGMFTIVVPLVFVTISSSISSMTDMARLKKILKTLLVVFVSTGAIASVLILFVVYFYPPASGVALNISATEALKPFSTGDQIVSALTVTDFPLLISRKICYHL